MDTGVRTLDVRLLGEARFAIDGVPIKFAKRGVTVAMLGYLMLQRGKPVARELLSYTLFPDLEEQSALAELRRYLYLAAKALPAAGEQPWIISDGDTVSWNSLARAEIDVRQFDKHAESRETYAAAVDVYGGDLLPEIYEDWVLVERERLRTKYLGVLSALVSDARRARDYKAAIAYAKRLLAEDPWREDIVRQVLAARYEMGDGAGAQAEFERFARSLREELQTSPMPETCALRDAIVAGTPLPSQLDKQQDARGPRPTGLPFQGRQVSVERLHRAWERAARSNGTVVAIEGEPGAGKSRLAAEFAILVEDEGGRVLAGLTGCPERVPYQCVTDVVRGALRLVGAAPRDAVRDAVLASILPELRSDAGAGERATSVEPERDRLRLFDAIGSLLAALARTRPLLVILEDLHWAGEATLDLVGWLARRAASIPMLVLITLRDDEAPPDHPLRRVQRTLADERLAARLPLARLTSADVIAVVAAMSDPRSKGLDAGALFQSSEGNPLFLNEAIEDALERGPSSKTPSGLGALIARRVERLSPEALALARAAAVCGLTFDADVATALSGSAGASSLAAMDELMERHVVRESAQGSGFDYAFTHHLIAATLYESIGDEERRRRHARAATALQRFGPKQLDGVASEIARHYAASGNGAGASVWYARAAVVSSAMFAHEDAVRFATFALEAATEPDLRVSMLLTREAANARIGRRAAQAADLDELEAMELDDARRCEVLQRRIDLLHPLEDRDAELRAIEALRSVAGRTGIPYWRAVAEGAHSILEISQGKYAEAAPHAQEALSLLDDRYAGEKISYLGALVEINAATGNPAEAERLLRKAVEVADAAGDARALVLALMQSIAFSMTQQQFERVVEYATKAGEIYRLHGDRLGEARALANMAAALLRLGRWQAAREANLQAAKTFELVGDHRGLGRVFMNLGMLHGRCGDLAEGRRYFRLAREHQIRLSDDRARAASLLNDSFLALWQGAASEALAYAREAMEISDRINHAGYRAAALANLGAAQRELGDLAVAIEHMERGVFFQLELGRLPDAVSDLADLALTYALAGNLEKARHHVDTILSVDPSWTEAAIYPPYPLWVAARVLHALEDKRAAAILAKARESCVATAAGIDAPELRASFEALPFVAEITAAAERGVWPPLASHASTGPARR